MSRSVDQIPRHQKLLFDTKITIINKINVEVNVQLVRDIKGYTTYLYVYIDVFRHVHVLNLIFNRNRQNQLGTECDVMRYGQTSRVLVLEVG